MRILQSNKGFTFIEMVVVVVILGLLAVVAVGQYGRMMEKGRAEEAKQNLWEIRVAWGQYTMDHREPLDSFSDLNLSVSLCPHVCRVEHFFQYDINDTHAFATRCTSGGKVPQGHVDYQIAINLQNGTWSGMPE
jgi:prepilin-type N-terminal cleavage/methylation domain-containing protein